MDMAQQQQRHRDSPISSGQEQEIYMSYERDETQDFVVPQDDYLKGMESVNHEVQSPQRQQHQQHDLPATSSQYQQQQIYVSQPTTMFVSDRHHQAHAAQMPVSISDQTQLAGPPSQQHQQLLHNNSPNSVMRQQDSSTHPQQQIELHNLQSQQTLVQQLPPQPQEPPTPAQTLYHAMQAPGQEQQQQQVTKVVDPGTNNQPEVSWSYNFRQVNPSRDSMVQAQIPNTHLEPTTSGYQSSQPQPLQPQHLHAQYPHQQQQQPPFEHMMHPEYPQQQPPPPPPPLPQQYQHPPQSPDQYSASIYPNQSQQQLMPPPQSVHQQIMPCEDQNPGIMMSAHRYNNPETMSSSRRGMDPRVYKGCSEYQGVPYIDGESWSSISYHEYDKRIGEKFHATNSSVIVDGYTHPQCPERFCVGGLSNVTRNDYTEFIRRRIGKGVKLSYINHDIYVECLSDACIFVSLPMLSMEEEIGEQVLKLKPGTSAKVFGHAQFSNSLSKAMSIGFEPVFKLVGMCCFNVSFVKGWGSSYKRRTVMETPCWIEVQMNGPLQWLDKMLRQMKPPAFCGSTS